MTVRSKCEVCGKRAATAVVVVHHLAVNVCRGCARKAKRAVR